MFDRGRVDVAFPRDLGIHSAAPAVSGDDELPVYVERDFDFSLRTALTSKLPGRGTFLVMVGGSSTGKTRSLYEAVYGLVPDWWLVQPAEAAEMLEWKNAPPRDTVFWLDELHHYIGGDSPLTSECVRVLVRHGNLVVGTMWPEQYARWTAGRDDVHRLVRSALVIPVPDRLNDGELVKAEAAAEQDSRIHDALRSHEVGMTQVLAGGPRLVMSWEQPANPYTRALITAVADAHRLGVQSGLSEELLTGAMYGYLHERFRSRSTEYWLTQAVPPATEPLYGTVSPLFPVDGGRPGTFGGYKIADYLAQHVRRRRRTEPIPHEAWIALVTRLRHREDLRRLADSAVARFRYHYAERALGRLVLEFDDSRAAVQLADLLIRQYRLEEARQVLEHAAAREQLAATKLVRLYELHKQVEQLRPSGSGKIWDVPPAVAEILADGGLSDGLRQDAAAGDAIAADRLVELLLERGCRRELHERAERGELRSAEALADLYLGWGDVDRLRERAEAGDAAAELRLSKFQNGPGRGGGEQDEIDALRKDIEDGDAEAPGKLCSLLFDLRDEANLRAEIDAGTAGAVDRLLALYTAQDHPSLIRLRAFGLDADGRLHTR